LTYRNLKKRIKKNEGYSKKPYTDQLGFLTIGYGHLIKPNEKHFLKNKFNNKDFKRIFLHDFNKSVNDYNKNLRFYSSQIKDKELLIEMIFQIGVSGVLKFKKLLKNISKDNKNLVCFEMMDSVWYKQTPKRVKKLIRNYLRT
tara:strand:- start:359 stop:787 length:429 start_codon:yes stop_codon:yes gene_type:complete